MNYPNDHEPALAQMMRLYELHAGDGTMRLVLAEYEACVVQMNRSANQLAVLGEPRGAALMESRALDMLRQAHRHVDAITQRKDTDHANPDTQP